MWPGGWEAAKRSKERENPVAFEVHYREYQRQAAWINHEDWKIERAAWATGKRGDETHTRPSLLCLEPAIGITHVFPLPTGKAGALWATGEGRPRPNKR